MVVVLTADEADAAGDLVEPAPLTFPAGPAAPDVVVNLPEGFVRVENEVIVPEWAREIVSAAIRGAGSPAPPSRNPSRRPQNAVRP